VSGEARERVWCRRGSPFRCGLAKKPSARTLPLELEIPEPLADKAFWLVVWDELEEIAAAAALSREPGAFSVHRFAQDVQRQRHVPLDLEIEHADTNMVGPILKGIGEADSGRMAPAARTLNAIQGFSTPA